MGGGNEFTNVPNAKLIRVVLLVITPLPKLLTRAVRRLSWSHLSFRPHCGIVCSDLFLASFFQGDSHYFFLMLKYDCSLIGNSIFFIFSTSLACFNRRAILAGKG